MHRVRHAGERAAGEVLAGAGDELPYAVGLEGGERALAPAATAWDTLLWRAAERYIRIGFGLLDLDPDEHIRRRHAHEDLVAVFRQRDPDAAAQAVFTHLDHNEQIALSALGPAV